MKTNVVEKGQWERELEVEVPAERIEAEYTKACRRYQKRLEVPGFRKGKVPLNLVRRRFGDAIRSEVIQDLLPILMQEAAREAGVVPAAPPSIGKLEHEPGEALIFTAHVDIWPEIEVGNYDKLRVTRMVHEVTDQEIDDQLKEMQNRHATERSVDRPLEKGDVLIADLQRLDDGAVPIIGDKYEERYFIIGAGDAPSPEFEEATLGMRQGDERQVRFAYRDDLPNQELAGKQEFFSVTARDVRERQMPELDDDFAKDVGEQFETLEALRAHVAQSMARQWEFMGRQKLRGDLGMRINGSACDWYAWQLSASLGTGSVPIKGSPPVSVGSIATTEHSFKYDKKLFDPRTDWKKRGVFVKIAGQTLWITIKNALPRSPAAGYEPIKGHTTRDLTLKLTMDGPELGGNVGIGGIFNGRAVKPTKPQNPYGIPGDGWA